MTVSANARKAGPLACNGSVVAFDFDFTTIDDDDVQVILATSAGVETVLTKTTHYTVALNADQTNNPGGTVTTVSTYASGNTITILGARTYDQQTALTNLGGFFPTVINAALDKLTMLVQQIKEVLDRTVRLPASSGASTELPAPVANRAIGWNADGTALTNITSLPEGLAISGFMETVLDDTTAAAAASTMGVLPLAGGTMTGLFSMASRVDVAGGATVDLGAQTSNNLRVTGSGATITSFGTTYRGPYFIQFNGVNTLVHNESSAPLLLVPGKGTLTTAAGDRCLIVPTGNDGWSIHNYERSDGTCSVLLENTYKALSASVGSNILTITLAAGTVLQFPDGTTYSLSSAITLAVPDTATLGTSNGVASRLWVVAMKNSGVPELAVINTWDGTDIHAVLPTDEITTVAIGTGSDSAHVWYSTTLRSNQPIAIVGYVESTQATAGTWATSPSKTQGYGRDIPLPGTVVQTRRNFSGTGQTGTTTIPEDNTKPQVTEGDQYYTKSITPRSALNLLEVDWKLNASNGNNPGVTSALFSTTYHATDALACAHNKAASAADSPLNHIGTYRVVAGGTSSITFNLRAGGHSAGTTRINYLNGGTAAFNGTLESGMLLREIMR